ncbi:MAG: urease accessory protein UreD [Cyanothece sp. SIO1E1]|nr:urease accessory protein UreD [Cyanothece sp. SIO1E1]
MSVGEDGVHSSAWLGNLTLSFAHEHGRTKSIHTQAQAPLKVQRSHYPEGPAICYTTIVHTAGGMVGGDRLAQSIHLQPHSQVLITTPAAGKVYRSTGATSVQSTQIRIEADGWLEWLPQETIIFNGAQYHQQLHIDLAPNAQVLLWDITRLGRSARGEQFLQGYWRSDLDIWQGETPLLIDHQALSGSAEVVSSAHGLNNYPVVGTLTLAGHGLTDSDLTALRERMATTAIPGQQLGLTRTLKGFACRYRGPSSQAARQCFTTLWQYLRQCRYGKIPSIPRLWC